MKKGAKKTSTQKLKLTWYGHSAFLLESPKGTTVLIDPWLENPKAPAGAKDMSRVDVILVSHGHADHLGNTIELAQKTNAQVISIYELYLYLQRKGVTNAQGMNKGGTMQVNGIKVTMTDARHSSDIDIGGDVFAGGAAAGFVVQLENGYKVYHAGDTALFGDMKFIGQLYKPHVALLPIGDLYTMGPRQAAKASELINPKHIIGMHYGTFPVLTGTPSQLKKYLPAKMKNKVKELQPGITTTIS